MCSAPDGRSPAGAALLSWFVLAEWRSAAPLAGRLIHRFGTRSVLAGGLLSGAAGLALLSFLNAPYPGLAGSLVSTAMETGPPLGLAMLTWAASTYSHVLAVGYPFALRAASMLLSTLALIPMTHHPKEEPQ